MFQCGVEEPVEGSPGGAVVQGPSGGVRRAYRPQEGTQLEPALLGLRPTGRPLQGPAGSVRLLPLGLVGQVNPCFPGVDL